MQKLINVLAVVSFAVSAGVVAGGTYVYLQKDAMIESVKENITKELQGIIGDVLGGGLSGGLTPDVNSSVPEVPGATETPIQGVPSVPF